MAYALGPQEFAHKCRDLVAILGGSRMDPFQEAAKCCRELADFRIGSLLGQGSTSSLGATADCSSSTSSPACRRRIRQARHPPPASCARARPGPFPFGVRGLPVSDL